MITSGKYVMKRSLFDYIVFCLFFLKLVGETINVFCFDIKHKECCNAQWILGKWIYINSSYASLGSIECVTLQYWNTTKYYLYFSHHPSTSIFCTGANCNIKSINTKTTVLSRLSPLSESIRLANSINFTFISLIQVISNWLKEKKSACNFFLG